MNIGILTFFESDNYGTVLQAYALQRYLEKQGHVAVLIHIRRNVDAKSVHFKSVDRIYTLKQRIWNRFVMRQNVNKAENKKKKFQEFREEFLNITSKCYETGKEFLQDISNFDLIISGGDQIWNPYHKVFSLNYMLDFLPEEFSRISYGSSFGVEDILDDNILFDMKNALKKYDEISVRETSGVDIISKMNLKACQVVDPVFLINDEWNRFVKANSPMRKKYGIVYSLVDYADECDSTITTYAKEHQLEMIILPESRRNCMNRYKKAFDLSPTDFINYIAHSEIVFTNSFHGLAFAILFKKKFVLLEPVSPEAKSKQNRLYSLLSLFGINPIDIDYVQTDKMMQKKIEQSQEFLKNAIDEKK